MQAILKLALRIPPGTSDAKINAAVGTLAAMLSGDEPAVYVSEPVAEPTLVDRLRVRPCRTPDHHHQLRPPQDEQ